GYKTYYAYATGEKTPVGIKRLISSVEVTVAGYGFYCWLWFLLLVKTEENILSS
nr:hypothetical protein [Tanacetum cinerariifolium]